MAGIIFIYILEGRILHSIPSNEELINKKKIKLGWESQTVFLR